MTNTTLEAFNYKFGRYIPIKVLGKLDSRIIKVIEYPEKEPPFQTAVFLEYVRGKDGSEIVLFPEGSIISTGGYDIVVDKAETIEGGFKIFWKYIQTTQPELLEEHKSRVWSFLDSGRCYKKIHSGYNFLTIRNEDKVTFQESIPELLEEFTTEERRKHIYFDGNIDPGTIIFLEDFLGLPGIFRNFFEAVGKSGIPISTSIRSEDLICNDMTDPKMPIQVCVKKNTDEFIEEIIKYVENK